MSRQAIFRIDAGGRAGGGHAKRCLALAHELMARGWRCCFASPADLRNTAALHLPAGLKIIHLAKEPGEQIDAMINAAPGGCDLLVIDDYGLNADFEIRCRPWARRILVIDDLNDRVHDCDALVNSAPGWRATDYAGHVPGHCRFFFGPRYALLGCNIRRVRRQRHKARNTGVRRVVVAMGLTDPDNATSLALSALAIALPTAKIDVLISSDCPHIASIRAQIARSHGRARLHLDARSPARIMAGADLAVGAAGVMAWERCCLGLASVLMVLAENQKCIAQSIADAGAGVVAGRIGVVSRKTLAIAIRRLATSPRRRLRIGWAAAKMCDGLGGPRIIDAIINGETIPA